MRPETSPIIPELEGVAIDDAAEPLDADVAHDASLEEVDQALGQEGDR